MAIITGRWINGLTAGATTESPSGSWTYQNRFIFNMPWQVTEVGWLRSDTTSDPPLRAVIGIIGKGPMRVVEPLNDDGTVGWQWTDIDPVAGDVAFNVGASLHFVAGGKVAKWTSTPDLPNPREGQFNGQVSQGGWVNAITYNDAGAVATLPVYGVDIGYRLNTLASAPDFNVDVEAELARWLREDGDHYDEGVLKLAYGQAAGANEKAEANGTAIAAVKTDTQSLLDRLTEAWRDTVASNTNGIPGFLTAWDAFYTQFVDITAPAVANLVEAVGEFTGISVLVYLANLIRWANGINQPPQLAEGPDWELLDEIDFTNNLLWPVEADVYRVTISAFDPAGTSEPVGTETRHAYLGKWCPFNVQFSSEWHYFNTEAADLSLGGRMPGLGLILSHGGAGHVQAWRRTEAP